MFRDSVVKERASLCVAYLLFLLDGLLEVGASLRLFHQVVGDLERINKNSLLWMAAKDSSKKMRAKGSRSALPKIYQEDCLKID